MDAAYLYSLDEELFDFCDTQDYADSLDSPCSAGSDIENQIVYDNPHPTGGLFQATFDSLPAAPNFLGLPGLVSSNSNASSGSHNHHTYNNNNNNTATGKPPVKKVMQRRAANLRERRRMKSINDAFEALRTCIPARVQAERRLSKVDTLRLAIRYISYLSELLRACGDYGRDAGSTHGARVQEKVIVRCHLADRDTDCGDGQMLLGHSLSWDDTKGCRPKPDSKLVARVWIPENPTESDLINLATYSGDC